MSSQQVISLDANELAYETSDFKAPSLKTKQIYKWRITKFEATKSKVKEGGKGGNPMVVLELAPVTANGKVLTQYSQRKYIVVPSATVKANTSEKGYQMMVKNYLGTVQALAAPRFNAFSKVEHTETGTIYYDKDGNVVKGKAKSELVESTKKAMMDARNEFLAGEVVQEGQEAYAAFNPPTERNEYPELGYFAQDVSADSALPFADSIKEMVG
jgi:hypothetical protein